MSPFFVVVLCGGVISLYTSGMDTVKLVLDSADAGAVVDFALGLGFSTCGIVPLGRAAHFDFFQRWLALGRAQEMSYLARFVDRREDPRLLAGTDHRLQSMIVVALDYGHVAADERVLADPSRGRLARYAWQSDYHEVVRPLLFLLDGFVRQLSGRAWFGKGLVDTGPVLERDWAMQTGLGFTGKNCCTIHPVYGSWLFLATLCVPEEFDLASGVVGDEAFPVDAVLGGLPLRVRAPRAEIQLEDETAPVGCGACARCMVACPTDAFVGPYHLDPARCISYWTIESRSAIPVSLRARFGNRIFGCDICQDVCPWNRRRTLFGDSPLGSVLLSRVAPPLLDGFAEEHPYWLDDGAFSRQFAGTPVLRARRAGMLRNVCIALGNWGSRAAVAALTLALEDVDALGRGHAAWALGRIGAATMDAEVASSLRQRLAREDVDGVRGEIRSALAGW